jgi:hypothetical protein
MQSTFTTVAPGADQAAGLFAIPAFLLTLLPGAAYPSIQRASVKRRAGA